MKTEFVTLVSHELRTPLTSIKGYVDLLADGEVGPISAEQAEFLGVVRSNADRLVGLINDLLDISAIEAGKVRLELVPTDASALIRGVVPMLRTQIEAKGQTLTIDLPDDLPPVLADGAADRTGRRQPAVQRQQVHARRRRNRPARAGGGRRLARVGLGLRDRADVRGAGQAVHEVFRAANPTTAQVAGTGLGLTITKAMVEATAARSRSPAKQAAGRRSASRSPWPSSTRNRRVRPRSSISSSRSATTSRCSRATPTWSVGGSICRAIRPRVPGPLRPHPRAGRRDRAKGWRASELADRGVYIRGPPYAGPY